ncbi:uncharacterized protein LOC104422838 isoform X1 [Eucalyptus grandis]|uniref:Uncharacterized protein n=3 Tax=Eucalyptus grandis TaxID=71139 RepID=A0ACC3J9M3_EUCGR|nr:uncharacterized protein LOC104422838 isoform X1 [Eucalyptus grandis]KAK3410574.1 hypothetical protein EUGRSUZ_J02536 [Eucalyptus grandis]
MFVKKLVEKAAKKPGGRNTEGLKSSDINPHIVFHYGIPSGCTKFAYDSIQSILAVSTKNGQIKLYGKDNTQVILESEQTGPSKFMQFIENQGILLNVTFNNQIEVWDIDKKLLSHIYNFKDAITSLSVLQHSLYMYAGDPLGNVSVLKLNQEPYNLVQMKYTIPFEVSHGIQNELSGHVAVMHALPQPLAESKRVLIIYEDGLFVLWEIRESKSIFKGGNMLQSAHNEGKKVTSACWACPLGSKAVIGYSTGDIFIWSVPIPNGRSELVPDIGSQSGPICKLNLGYKLDRTPISSMRCVHTDGKPSRLYFLAAPDAASSNLLQVVLLNDHSESRTIKLGLQLPEPCIDMEIISNYSEQTKQKRESLLVIGKSEHLYEYDDSLIEKYLLQCQSKSAPPIPKEVRLRLPLTESSITVAKFITSSQCISNLDDEDYIQLVKKVPPLLHSEKNGRDASQINPIPFGGFAKVKNLYVTGHSNGAINFWDMSCPLPLPIFSVEQQSEDDFSLSGVALTALCFDAKHQILVSGDQNGMVRIYKFKPEAYVSGSAKRGNNRMIGGVKALKVNGVVLSLNMSCSSRHLVVGSDQGYVALIDVEGPHVQFTKQISSDISTGIISVQLGTCALHGFQKNILVMSTRDSSVVALDSDTGTILSNSMVHPKKPSRALFLEILELNTEDMVEDSIFKQGLLLLCSEKAVYVYSLPHVVQGVKKVIYKKKFHSSSCCWGSTFYTPNAGLMLLFTCGKIEIRSLPELSLIRETYVRGLAGPTSKGSTINDNLICSSSDGQLLMVNKDQEIFLFSVLLQTNMFRLLGSLSQVYQKDLVHSTESLSPVRAIQKEKPKGLFSSVFKDTKVNREKHAPDTYKEDPRASIEELSTIFSTANFSSNIVDIDDSGTEIEKREDLAGDEDDDELNIDDIDIGDSEEKPRGQNLFGGLNKKVLANKFQSFKGKLKHVKIKNEKSSTKEEQQDEKIGAVDQIKRKYGFASSSETTGAAKMAESKLQENSRKLQGISLKTTEMQDTAKSFSSMAKEVLRVAEHDKRTS